MKNPRRLLAALSLALVAAAYAAWGVLPSSNAQDYVPIREARDSYAARDSLQAPKARFDSLFLEEYVDFTGVDLEGINVGPSVGSTPPGTCNSGTFRGQFWYDTGGSDSGLKWCNNEDGSYDWDLIALDADRDGFSIIIDNDDADDAVYARNLTTDVVQAGVEIGPSGDVILTGTLAYAQSTQYTGSDVQITTGGSTRSMLANSAGTRNCNSFMRCRDLGDQYVISATVTSNIVPVHRHSRCSGTETVLQFWENSSDFSVSASTTQIAVASLTCGSVIGL